MEIPPDLVGKEDTATFSLSGVLDFDRAYVMRPDIERAARASLLADTAAVPAGTDLLADSITMEVGAVTTVAGELQVEVSMRAVSQNHRRGAVRDRVTGLSVADRGRAGRPREGRGGAVWPGWVDHVPRLGFRISVQTVAPAASAS